MSGVLADLLQKVPGTITQADGDSGDSAQRNATVAFLRNAAQLPAGETVHYLLVESYVRPFRVGKGRYRRSSDPSHWGYDPTNFSRDQMSIVMLAIAAAEAKSDWGEKGALKDIIKEMIKRGGFHQNFLRGTDDPERKWKLPDFVSPPQISAAIRGLNLWPLYPFLLLLDVGFLADLHLRKYRLWDYDNMLAQNLMFAVMQLPTPISKLAYNLYAKTDFLERIRTYHDPEKSNGIAGMHELFVEADRAVRAKYL